VRALDAHTHVVVSELLGDGGEAQAWRPRVRWEGTRQIVELGGRAISSAVDEFVELETILAHQHRRGIDHVLLSPWVPLLFGAAPMPEALRRCRLQNAGLARLRALAPDRVSVLGAVPLQDPVAAAAELERLMSTGSFAGVEVTASVGSAYLGDPRFAPFWAAAEACSALVFVHPTTRGFADPVFEEDYLWNLVGNPFETTIAAANLVMGGTMERHPGLRVLLAHAGGAIVALRGRLRHGHAAVAAAGRALSTAPDELIGRFYFDTITHDPALLAALVEAVGAERVLLGSDYPFDMADPDPVGTVRAAALGPEAESAVLYGNAARLLGLPELSHA
jgi:aminocarboxymuconate-semialdehyde decarboxylase